MDREAAVSFLRAATADASVVEGITCGPVGLAGDGTISRHPDDTVADGAAVVFVTSERRYASFVLGPELLTALVADLGNHLPGDARAAVGRLFLGSADRDDLEVLEATVGTDVRSVSLKDEMIVVPESDEVRGWRDSF